MATQITLIAETINQKGDEIYAQRVADMAASGNDSVAKKANVSTTKDSSMTAKSDAQAEDEKAYSLERGEKESARDAAVTAIKTSNDPAVLSLSNLLVEIENSEDQITNEIISFNSDIDGDKSAMIAAIGTEADVLAVFATATSYADLVAAYETANSNFKESIKNGTEAEIEAANDIKIAAYDAMYAHAEHGVTLQAYVDNAEGEVKLWMSELAALQADPNYDTGGASLEDIQLNLADSQSFLAEKEYNLDEWNASQAS